MFWGLNQQASTLELSAGERKKLKDIAEESRTSEDQHLKTTANEILKLEL